MMMMAGSWSSPMVTVLLVALTVVAVLQGEGVEAKRGCANFGHSCYGGMGKRGSDLNDEVAQEINRQEEDPALVFTGPRSEFRPQKEQVRLTSQQLYNLSPFLRQWLRSLRNMQELRTPEDK